MQIIEASDADLDRVMRVQREAFGRDDEAQLVAALLRDPTAQPAVSLLAWQTGQPIGHALFTKVTLDGDGPPVSAAILAPLAVVPAWQRQGIGRALIEHGVGLLAARGGQWLFVLGDPDFYTRCGFEPAIPHGLHAPYPIIPEAAWMVRALGPGRPGSTTGTIACADALAPPQYWRE